jgi:hypothetical protein
VLFSLVLWQPRTVISYPADTISAAGLGVSCTCADAVVANTVGPAVVATSTAVLGVAGGVGATRGASAADQSGGASGLETLPVNTGLLGLAYFAARTAVGVVSPQVRTDSGEAELGLSRAAGEWGGACTLALGALVAGAQGAAASATCTAVVVIKSKGATGCAGAIAHYCAFGAAAGSPIADLASWTHIAAFATVVCIGVQLGAVAGLHALIISGGAVGEGGGAADTGPGPGIAFFTGCGVAPGVAS